jgi:hypothetical protein
MLGEVLVHLERGHLVFAEDPAELVIGQDLAAVGLHRLPGFVSIWWCSQDLSHQFACVDPLSRQVRPLAGGEPLFNLAADAVPRWRSCPPGDPDRPPGEASYRRSMSDI